MTDRSASPSLSVIIPNYNYGIFVEAAIESALALDWPHKQVIVVDDGSSDDSWDRIAPFAARGVETIRQANAGQLAACETGFARATGSLVMFLDSDDMVSPDLMRHVAPAYRPGVAKIQVQMYVIDGDGRRTGSQYPKFPTQISPADIRRWVRSTSAYPTPPGSGNIYARDFLNQILPINNPLDRFSDSYCLSAAPQLGDIETIDRPLVAYRVHGANDGAMTQLQATKFAVELQRAGWRTDFARSVSRDSADWPPDPVRNSIPVLVQRASSLRLCPKRHPLPGDGRWQIAADYIRASRKNHHLGGRTAMLLGLWTMGILFLPHRVAARLVSWRFVPASRPRSIRRLIDRA